MSEKKFSLGFPNDELKYVIDTNINYYQKELGYSDDELELDIEKLQKFVNMGLIYILYLYNEENDKIGYIQYHFAENGYIMDLDIDLKESLWISDIFLEKEYRGKKLSNILMNDKSIINYVMKKIPLSHYSLFSYIEKNNHPSITTHFNHGFEIINCEENAYGEGKDANVLYKSLDDKDYIEELVSDDYKGLSLFKVKPKSIETTDIGYFNKNLEQTNFREKFEILSNELKDSSLQFKMKFLYKYQETELDTFIKKVQDINNQMEGRTNELIEKYSDVKMQYKNGLINLLTLDYMFFTLHPFANDEQIEEIISRYREYQAENCRYMEIKYPEDSSECNEIY